MACFYIAAGINHFSNREAYLQIMPPWLPYHRLLIDLNGGTELALGALLLITPTRRIAACGLIVLLVIVFPANIQMMLNYEKQQHPLLWLTILRLPLQPLLIWWAWIYAKPQ